MTTTLIILASCLAAAIGVGVWIHARRERSPVGRDFRSDAPLRYVDLEPTEYSTFWLEEDKR